MLNYYDRSASLICLESDVLENEELLPSLQAMLPDHGLFWYWNSARRYPPRLEFEAWNLPERRQDTPVTIETLPTLRRDLLEQDLNDDNRALVLMASDTDLIQTFQDVEATKWALRAFAEEVPPLRAVLVRIGDTGSCHIFLPHIPAVSVLTWLAAWNINPAHATKRYPYKQLKLARFESLFDLEVLQ